MWTVDCGLWIGEGARIALRTSHSAPSPTIHHPPSTILETPVSGSSDIAVAAFAPLPKTFGDKDRQRLAVAVRTLADGTAEYSRSTIFRLTEGRGIEASLLPDGVLIRFTMPKETLANGLAIMEGLLRRPSMEQGRLDAMLTRLQRHEKDYWSAALSPQNSDLKRVAQAEERALLLRVFQPNRTIVSIAGGFEPGVPQELWAARVAEWRPTIEPRYPDVSPTPEPTDNPSGVTTVELRGTPFAISDPALAARWLALVAMGVGKGGSLFRDVRQTQGWSYRQEAILWPDLKGLIPRIVVASAPEEGEAARAEALRDALLKAVEAWKESDRTRALAMASVVLKEGTPLGPLWLDRPVGGDLAARASLDAYWFAKAGIRWNSSLMLGTMANVSLDDLKAEASAMLKAARPIVLPGR